MGPRSLPAGPDASLAAVHALYWFIANLARRGPVAIVVDDAHCADVPSLRLLAYLARRVTDVPVTLLVAVRSGGNATPEPLAEALASTPGATRLRLQPLSPAAGAELAGSLRRGARDDFRRACHAASGGNPFFLRELVLAFDDQDAADLLPIDPKRLAGVVLERIAQGPPGTAALARAAAVLGRNAALRHAATIAGLSSHDAATAAEALVAIDVLACRRPLEFRHPLLRAAVAASVPLDELAAAHAHAARLLAAEDAPPERVAVHLLAADPQNDPWVATLLAAAGRAAADRAAPEAAVRFLRRALAEPPPAGQRPDVLFGLGAAELAIFDVEAARRHLRAGLDLVSGSDSRLRGALLLSGVLFNDGHAEEAVDVLEAALNATHGADPELRVRVEANLVNVARNQPAARRRAHERSLHVLGRVQAGTENAPALLASAAAELAMTGADAERSADLAERALSAAGAAWSTLDAWPFVAVRCLAIADRPDPARCALDAAVKEATATGARYQLRILLLFRAELAYRVGDLAAAEADARGALDRVDAHGWSAGTPFAAAFLVLTLLERDEPRAAQALLRAHDLETPATECSDLHSNHLLLYARGRLRVEHGDVRTGLEDLLECGRRECAIDEPNPAICDWRSQAALALARLGKRDTARELVDEELRLALTFGAPRAIGVAQRAAGLLAGDTAGLELLREAASTLAASPAQLESARALADLGAALRRHGQRVNAREVLRRALERAHVCGASALETRVRAELRAAGGRPRRTALSGPTPSRRASGASATSRQVETPTERSPGACTSASARSSSTSAAPTASSACARATNSPNGSLAPTAARTTPARTSHQSHEQCRRRAWSGGRAGVGSRPLLLRACLPSATARQRGGTTRRQAATAAGKLPNQGSEKCLQVSGDIA